MARPLENLPRALTTLGVMVATILTAAYAFVNSNYFLMAAVVIAAPMVAMINNPPAWVVAIIGLSLSNLIIPGLPQGLQVFHFLMAGFCLLTLARNILLRSRVGRMPVSFMFLWAFMLLLLFIISQRGFGLKMTGGSTVGGSLYMKFFIGAAYLFCSRYIMLDTRQWRIAIVLMFIGGLVPFVAEAMFELSRGSIQFQYHFIEAYVSGLLDTLEAMETGSKVVRISSLAPLASSLLMLTLLLTPRGLTFTIRTYLLIGLCIALGGLSGFRSVMLENIGVLVMFHLLAAPRHARARRLFKLLGLIAVGLVLLMPVLAYLPAAIQRTFAWLPFANIDPIALSDANASVTWRLDLWKYCLENSSDYLWVGRGLIKNMDVLMSPSVIRDSILGPWFGHAYHNGPLGLLIDTGIPGLVLVTLFLIFAVYEIWTNRLSPADPFILRFLIFIKAKILISIIVFYFIVGSISIISTIFLYLAIFYALQVTETGLSRKRADRDFALVDPSFGSSNAVRPSRR